MSSAEDLKLRKEQFVTGLTGGTVLDIYLVTSVSLAAYFVYCLLNTYTRIFTNNKFNNYNITLFTVVLDYLLNWLPLLLSITTYANHIRSLIYGFFGPLVFLAFFNYDLTSESNASLSKKKQTDGDLATVSLTPGKLTKKQFLPKRSYLTVYRSQMLVVTAIAILAVDFNIFPRRFAKCETWGTSLMDLGVGSFVFSMGIVSARQSIWSKFTQDSKQPLGRELLSLLKKIVTSFRSSVTVFALGIGRLFLVKWLNYQEHVTEYGVHWNFFVTLSLLSPFKYVLEFVFSLLRVNYSNAMIGVLISAVHEYWLQRNNKQYLAYLVSSERLSVWDMNKEGISSLVGYIAIFLIGESVGGFLLPGIVTPFNLIKNSTELEIIEYHSQLTYPKPNTSKHHSKLYFFLRSKLSLSSDACLVVYAIFFDALSLYAHQHNTILTHVSRRFANFSYVLFIAAYNLNYLVGFKLINKLFNYLDKKPKGKKITKNEINNSTNNSLSLENSNYNHVPFSLESINNNGMLIFLVSNVLTGLINMSMNTLDAGPLLSVTTLVGYSLIINLVAMLFNYYGIYIKL